MTHQNVTLRVPIELVQQIDALAAAKSKELNLRIDRSQIIRQALARAIKEEMAMADLAKAIEDAKAAKK